MPRAGSAKGFADVYVTDGFVGNILLDSASRSTSSCGKKSRLIPVLERINYENIGGLPFLGTKGNVIIGHGISSPKAFRNMIFRALTVIQARLSERIAEAFQAYA